MTKSGLYSPCLNPLILCSVEATVILDPYLGITIEFDPHSSLISSNGPMSAFKSSLVSSSLFMFAI